MPEPQSEIYLRNTWYAIAWSDEVGREPLGRTLLGQPLVLFRTEAGEAVAIGDRCPHRFAPLSRGKLVGDQIECPYHGLRFGQSGMCEHNPHGNRRIPPKARVPNYVLAERHRLVWIWGGDVAGADATAIPDLAHLDDAALGTVKGYMPIDANYQLYVDNLMDLTHAQFVHGDFFMTEAFEKAHISVEQQGQAVTNRISIENGDIPPVLKRRVPDPDASSDVWFDSTWMPPSIVTNDVGVVQPRGAREAGVRSRGVHIVTPATRHHAHYFFANSRNFNVGDAGVDEDMRNWQRVAFGEQDKPIIEAAARLMEDEVDPLAMGAVMLQTDAAPVRVRRVLREMIAAERGDAAE